MTRTSLFWIGLLLSYHLLTGVRRFPCANYRVLDGDTLICRGFKGRLRLAMIDAPEASQTDSEGRPIGQLSTQALKHWLKRGRPWIEVQKYGFYGRAIVQVWIGERSASMYMLEMGQATIYRYYRFKNKREKKRALNALASARGRRLGLWGGGQWPAPWVYRQSKLK